MSGKLISKICHDLVTPASAINNGIELLETDPNNQEIFDLIVASNKALNAKLILFRACFGAKSSNYLQDINTLREVVQPFAKVSKIEITQLEIASQVPANKLHIIAIMFLVIHNLIPFGGQVSIKSNGIMVEIKIIGKTTSKGEEVLAQLNQGYVDEVNSSNAHIDYLLERAKDTPISGKFTQENEILILI